MNLQPTKKQNRLSNKVRRYSYLILFALILSGVIWFLEYRQPALGPSTGEEIEFLSNQTQGDLGNAYLRAMEKAEHSIMLIVYSLTDRRILQMLKEKSRQGVDVTVLTDAKASPYLDTTLGPHVHSIRYFGKALMHQKILIIDKKTILLGSANMTHDSLKMNGNLVMHFESPPMAELLFSRALTMQEGGRNVYYPHKEFLVANQKMELWLLPDNRDAIRKLEYLIDSAKKSIQIAMFAWTRRDLAWAVIDAHKRGVQVEVVLDQNHGKGASAKIVQLLKKHGIPVYLSEGKALLHHKFLYIDGQTLVNGSANWTTSAFTKNEDCFIILYNLSDKQKDEMTKLWNLIKINSKLT